MTNPFDTSLALHPGAQPHIWHAQADPQREANTGMFGGWTAALLLKAVLADAAATEADAGSPSVLSVNFLKVVPPGAALTLRTQLLSASRSLATWQVQLIVGGAAEPGAQESPATIATVVLAKRRDSHGFTEPAFPQVPPPDDLPKFHPPGPFGQHSLVRPAQGFPPWGQQHTRSLAWVRELSGRPLDAMLLAYLADNYPPRSWYLQPQAGPFSTLAMSVYFLASPQELAGLGDDYVLMEVAGTRAEASTVGAQARLWSRAGTLLVTTEQIGWFR